MHKVLTAGCNLLDLKYFQDFIKPTNLDTTFNVYKASPIYVFGSFQKFLCDRNNRFFMIEYINLDFLSQKYLSRIITYFPNKLIYCIIILFTFFWWVLINLPFIVYYFFLKLFSFYSFLIFRFIKKPNFSNECFLKRECIKEHLYYLYWLDLNVFFSYNANPYNKKVFKNLFTVNF